MSSAVISHTGRLRLVLGIGLVLAAGFATWVLWPQSAAAPQARRYLGVTACLLTGPGGVEPGAQADRVWASMQAASLSTRVMVSYLPDTGPADVPVLLDTLIGRQCGVIITVGASPAQVIKTAKANPRQRFLLIASPHTVLATPPNVIAASEADASGHIDQALRSLAVT
jgi:hypothetical protein